MPAKKKAFKGKMPVAQQEAEEINKTLLEDSLALAATERQINDDADIEERLRRIEAYEKRGVVVPLAPKKKKK